MNYKSIIYSYKLSRLKQPTSIKETRKNNSILKNCSLTILLMTPESLPGVGHVASFASV